MFDHAANDGNGRGERADFLIEFARDQAAKAKKPRSQSVPAFLTKDSVPGYDLAELIHRGGQGVVYRAVQKSTGRIAAIKFLPIPLEAEGLDGSRFRREVRALARVENKNVVAIRDSGVVGAYGYVVMDYVPGSSLTDYVAEHNLDVRETLRLFLSACDAVNGAHLQGIIHRDLKPSNIRVTPEGEPKILDFGLARIVADDEDTPHPKASVATITGQFLGSLPWASPEQARGDSRSVDVRTDVYALGVILFQLLADDFPYPVTGDMRTVVSAILDVAPSKPSAYNRSIKDDLDTIVLKCLQKERERRYQSVADLARDIGNYLDGKPIEAKRDSVWYVACKNLRRHWVAALIISIVVVFTFGYAMTTTILIRRARIAELETRAKFRLVHQTVQAVLREMGTQMERISGAGNARRAVLEVAHAQLLPLVSERSDDPALRADLGLSYFLLGDIGLKIGKTQEGRAYLLSALQIRRQLAEEAPDVPSLWDDLSINLVRIGDSYKEDEDWDLTLEYYMEALRIDEDLVRREPSNAHFRDNLAWSYQRLSVMPNLAMHLTDAESLMEKAYQTLEQAVVADPANPIRLYGLAGMKNARGVAMEQRGDWHGARQLHAEALGLMERAVAVEPDHPEYLWRLGWNYLVLAGFARIENESYEADSFLSRAEAIYTRLLNEEPEDIRNALQMTNVLGQRAHAAMASNDWAKEREALFRRLEILEDVLAKSPDNLDARKKKLIYLQRLAIRQHEHREHGIEDLLEEALRIAEQIAGDPNSRGEDWLAFSQLIREPLLGERRDTAQSVRAAQEAVARTDGKEYGPYLNLIEALVADGQIARAGEVQQHALTLLPPGASPIRAKIVDAVPE